MFARIALALTAVLVLAWLGVLLRDTLLAVPAAFVIIEPKEPSQARFEAAMDDLRAAELLNPDRTPRLNQARFLNRRRDYREALEIANEVAADEPDNIAAWVEVFRAASNVDDARAQQAKAKILELNPLALQQAGGARE
jgi:tetratricopeptide (TPR) repeat protein